jgi:hypothetical protein
MNGGINHPEFGLSGFSPHHLNINNFENSPLHVHLKGTFNARCIANYAMKFDTGMDFSAKLFHDKDSNKVTRINLYEVNVRSGAFNRHGFTPTRYLEAQPHHNWHETNFSMTR